VKSKRTGYEIAKRIFDFTLALVALALLWPVMLVVAILIRATSLGPVLYKARRLGRDGRVFHQLKFRSMLHNAPDLRNPDGSTLSTDDDPRVTAIGKFIRRTSLDELPQLMNVLGGQMSFVGPRPDPTNVTDLYRPQDFARQSVVPGITGWAIVHGRNEVPWEQRRDLDLQYVEIRSFQLDIKIILLTLAMVVTKKGVYTATDGTR
jgi:undecaprenyl phosphate N,N'-diacetylbacillosamine 1-phosphate transferase